MVDFTSSTAKTIIRNINNSKSVINKPRYERPKTLADSDAKTILRKIKKELRISVKKLVEEILNESGKVVNAETTSFTTISWEDSKKKVINSLPKQTEKRDFVNTYEDKEKEFGKLFGLQIKAKLLFLDLIKKKKNGEKSGKIQILVLTVKHGGSGGVVWGPMAAAGVGNLALIESTIDNRQYLNILYIERHFRTISQKIAAGKSLHCSTR